MLTAWGGGNLLVMNSAEPGLQGNTQGLVSVLQALAMAVFPTLGDMDSVTRATWRVAPTVLLRVPHGLGAGLELARPQTSKVIGENKR